MFRKLISIILLIFLSSGFVRADFESAKAAYEAGDYDTVIELITPLAEAGDAEAQFNLGVLYKNGLGVQQDYDEALKWYRKAAEQGYAIAQTNLGFMYDQGFGLPQNYTKAVMWYRKAAAQGDAEAQHNLGVMYGAGLGVKQNNIQAYVWLGFAGAGGIESAWNKRAAIESDLNPAQLKEALKLARELRDKLEDKTNQ